MIGDQRIAYPDPAFCQELRRRLKSWSNDALLELYHDADVDRRRDPRDCAAQAIRDELLTRGLNL